MPIELSARVVRAGGLMATPVDEEVVILNMARNDYVGLNDIGRRIWDLLATPRRVDDLCLQLSKEFEGDYQQLTADVLSFLAEMEREGLVNVGKAGSA